MKKCKFSQKCKHSINVEWSSEWYHWSWIWVTATRYTIELPPSNRPPYTTQNGTPTDPQLGDPPQKWINPPSNWSQWLPPNELLNEPEWTSHQITCNSPTNGPPKIHPTKTPIKPNKALTFNNYSLRLLSDSRACSILYSFQVWCRSRSCFISVEISSYKTKTQWSNWQYQPTLQS